MPGSELYRVAMVVKAWGKGGAGIAAKRLGDALRVHGHTVVAFAEYPSEAGEEAALIRIGAKDDLGPEPKFVQREIVDRLRTDLSNTIFSVPVEDSDIRWNPRIAEFDIIHLHWVASFLSPDLLQDLISLGKPIVWTAHDQWPITGGCHYTAGCRAYIHGCQDCPQLTSPARSLPQWVAERRRSVGPKELLTIVTPSHWLEQCVTESWMMGDVHVRTIFNSVETNLFTPSQRAIQSPREEVIILFGCENHSEKRKGYHVIEAAVRLLIERHGEGSALLRRLKFRAFGDNLPSWVRGGPSVELLGRIRGKEEMAQVLRDADWFLIPSVEDNLPNSAVEALSCGTPVLGLPVGGIRDIVRPGETGLLAASAEPNDLADLLEQVLLDSLDLSALRLSCRRTAVTLYAPEVVVPQYVKVYREALRRLLGVALISPRTPSSPNPLLAEVGGFVGSLRTSKATLLRHLPEAGRLYRGNVARCLAPLVWRGILLKSWIRQRLASWYSRQSRNPG